VLACATARVASAQQGRLRSPKRSANLEAKTQSRKATSSPLDGDVDIHYGDTRLRADHVEYDSETYEATATGHVQLDYGNEHSKPARPITTSAPDMAVFTTFAAPSRSSGGPIGNSNIRQSALFRSADVELFPGEVYLVHRPPGSPSATPNTPSGNSLARTRESVSIKPSRSLTQLPSFPRSAHLGSLTPDAAGKEIEKPGF